MASIEQRLEGGLRLFMEEVKACFSAEGGPYLEAHRAGSIPFDVPAPTLGAAPSSPSRKSKGCRTPLVDATISTHVVATGGAITWHEAWECARPWFKDPRVHQPQRLYHPDGWASGELDLVLRWDGHIRIVTSNSARHIRISQPRLNTNFDSMLVVARNPQWPNGPDGGLVP